MRAISASVTVYWLLERMSRSSIFLKMPQGDGSEGAINYIVKMETRVQPGVGGHKHWGRIARMGDGHVAAASADGVSADELWTIGEQQIRIVAATVIWTKTAIELDINVLVEVDSYTGDDANRSRYSCKVFVRKQHCLPALCGEITRA